MDVDARLRAFAAVARRGGFSAAAADLGISQPAVSKHVAALEAALGTRLVVREPRGARLTDAGEFLASHVSRAEALLARAAVGIASFAGAEAGRLTVAASGIPGAYLLPRALGPFIAARPGVHLDVRLGTSASALALVASHVAELGVIGGASSATELEVEPLIEDEIVLVGAPDLDGTASFRDLERHTWISREEGSGTRDAMERTMDALGLRPLRRLALPDWEMIKASVAAGAGIAAISRFAVEHDLAAGRLRQIEVRGWHVVRPIAMVYSRDVPLTPLGEHFAATLRRTLGGGGDAAKRAAEALEYAERADGRASVREVEQALADGIEALGDATEEERVLKARLRSLRAFWQVKDGAFDAARATLSEGLDEAALPASARADLLARRGWLAGRQDDPRRAVRILEEALEMARAAGNDAVERRAMLDLATAHSALGRHDEARSLLEDALRASRAAGDDDELLRAANNGAVILEATGDPVQRLAADELLLGGAEDARRLGDRHHLAWMQTNAAIGLVRRGKLREAERRLEEALALFEAIDERGGIAPAANSLAWVRLLLGDTESVDGLLAKGAHDLYRGSDETPLVSAELRSLVTWRHDRRRAADELHAALRDSSGRGETDTARGWLALARMAVRCGDTPRVLAARVAMADADLISPEERFFGGWLDALATRGSRGAAADLEGIARELEEIQSVLDAANAFADAAVLAAAAGERANARRLQGDRDRLLGPAGALPLLD